MAAHVHVVFPCALLTAGNPIDAVTKRGELYVHTNVEMG